MVPPCTWNVWPEMPPASGDARKQPSSATWTGSRMSFACCVPPSLSMERCVRQPICANRVLAPGMMEFAVTPYGAISVATASVNTLMPALAAT